MKKVYVAGPITRGSMQVNAEYGILTGDILMRAGFAPYVPHLTYYWQQLAPHTWEEWLKLDEEWLPCCDAVLRIPGPSQGADRECRLAMNLNIPIFYNLVDLIEWQNNILVEEIKHGS